MGKLGDLHLVKVQCGTNTLVTKVKLVERCFVDGVTVEFQMYDLAPNDSPETLPYFKKADGDIVTDENELAFFLAKEGAPHLVNNENSSGSELGGLSQQAQAINKAVKTALKSKNAEAMDKNKHQLKVAVAEAEKTLADGQAYLAGNSLSLADLLFMADLKWAFEKILDPNDQAELPGLSVWYQRCFDASTAVQKVWKGQLTLCEATVVEDKKKGKESKEDKKAREKARKAEKKAEKKSEPKKAEKAADGDKRHEEALTPREEDFAKWYSEIVIKAELLSYYDVSGCYILRPAAFAIWEAIQAWFDAKIKTIGVDNCMFPLFITEDCLKKEEEHLEDFAPEVAWVTRSGQTELEKPLAIRPTSETAMYPYYAQWIRSHRDLPLKLNQWTNVGHTAHETYEESREMVLQILDWYEGIYQELLAVPVIRGWKSKKEKFAGADDTTTVEAFIPDNGRGVQGATSHILGQNFAKMFGITFLDHDKEEKHVWQTSWGSTTRSIGVMIMTHGDSKGLVLPPRVAPRHAVFVPITMASHSEEERVAIFSKAEELAKALSASGVKAHADVRENFTPGNKYAQWEMKGVCLRMELGPKDMKSECVMVVRRDTGAKESVPWAALSERVPKMLEEMQSDMLARATEKVAAARKTVTSLDDFKAALADKKCILAPWCGETDVEEAVKAATVVKPPEGSNEPVEAGAKTLCIPMAQPHMPEGQMCIFSKELLGVERPAKEWALWGRSY